MSATIENQLGILKAYAERKSVYMRAKHKSVGKQAEPEGHLFNFERADYSLSPTGLVDR